MKRRVRAFLNPDEFRSQGSGLEEVRQQVRKVRQRKDKEIAELRALLAQKNAGGLDYGVKSENVIWIFAPPRSGTTWLSQMMGDIPDHANWNEPLVGAMLGYLYYDRAANRAAKKGKYFILGERYKKTWHEPVRSLVLGGAAARFPELTEDGYVVIKEPNGTIGAPLLMEAMPESLMIVIVRDPRDVMASSLDSRREGSWRHERRQREGQPLKTLTSEDMRDYAESFAKSYMRIADNSKQAYDLHEGSKTLVRYEDLRADTLGTMKRIYRELDISVGVEELARSVEKHSWEAIPEEKKGEGKFYRKATPGGWREDLTPEQIKTVERITAPLLEEFYPA